MHRSVINDAVIAIGSFVDCLLTLFVLLLLFLSYYSCCALLFLMFVCCVHLQFGVGKIF